MTKTLAVATFICCLPILSYFVITSLLWKKSQSTYFVNSCCHDFEASILNTFISFDESQKRVAYPRG